jgi:two-component system sensor histidine kinase YesM
MKKFKNIGIKKQILGFYLLSIILIVVILSSILYYTSTQIIKTEVLNSTKSKIDKSGKQLELYIEKLNSLSNLLSDDVQVCRFFGEKHTKGEVQKNDEEDILDMINTIIATNPEIVSIIFVGKDKKILSNEVIDMDFSGNVENQSWYKEIIKNSMPILTSARMQEFSMDEDDWVISLGSEIKDEKQNHLGVVRIDLKYNVIESILSDLDLGKNGYPFILNSSSELVYYKDKNFFEDSNKLQELIDIYNMDNPDLSKKMLLSQTYKLNNSDWILIGVSSLDGLINIKNNLFLTLWIIGSILIILTFIGSNIYISSISSPIKKLEHAMQNIDKYNMETNLELTGSKEIKELSKHFISMLSRIKTLMNEIKEKEKTLRINEFKTLQSQINPHFLYNTLDTIIWMAEFEEMEKVISLSKAMAKFFRLSLHKGDEFISRN